MYVIYLHCHSSGSGEWWLSVKRTVDLWWTGPLMSWHLGPDRGQEACGCSCQLHCCYLMYLSLCRGRFSLCRTITLGVIYAALTLTFTHTHDAHIWSCTLLLRTLLLPGGVTLFQTHLCAPHSKTVNLIYLWSDGCEGILVSWNNKVSGDRRCCLLARAYIYRMF